MGGTVWLGGGRWSALRRSSDIVGANDARILKFEDPAGNVLKTPGRLPGATLCKANDHLPRQTEPGIQLLVPWSRSTFG
jgi:hypothetical protein